MFQGTQYWWTHLINGFVGLWVHGQSWYAPFYYGALSAFAYSIRERMGWRRNIFLVLFVVGISLAHGAMVAILVLILLILMGGWLFGVPILIVAIYGLRKVVGSLRHTIHSRLDLAKTSLIKGGVSLVLVLVCLSVLSNLLSDWH